MVYSPSITPATCQGNSLQINDTVRSYFNNYTFYRWQRSVDNGNTWNDVTVTVDTTLTLIGSLYQFITSYTIPSTHTTLADSGDLYRVIVATSNPNLNNSTCLSTDASSIITLKVLDCGVPLGIDFISFSGKLNHGNADLIWTTSKESEPVSYSVERSYDGTSFSSITILPGSNNANAPNNTYKYTDMNVQGKLWYRIAMINKDGHKKYSRIIILEDKTVNFGLINVINPFSTKLDFGITVSENSRIDATLINMSGKPVRKESFNVYEGANNLTIVNTEPLSPGMYILQIRNKDQIINKKVMKK
jgi:trimeric autotransporter adhesin